MLSYSGPSPLCAAGRRAPGAADDAAAAGGAPLHVVLLEHLAGDRLGVLEHALAVVARRHRPGLVEDVDQHRRAELGQRRRRDGVGLEELLGLVHDELEPLGVGHRRLARAVAGDGDGLEVLGAHDRAEAAAADRAAAVVDDGGEEHAALAGRADDRRLRARLQLLEPGQRRRDVEAPEAGGVVEVRRRRPSPRRSRARRARRRPRGSRSRGGAGRCPSCRRSCRRTPCR